MRTKEKPISVEEIRRLYALESCARAYRAEALGGIPKCRTCIRVLARRVEA